MRYQPPYVEGDTPAAAGIHNADAEAAYSNGDATAGVAGSYVPAEAVEHTQREIVAAITAAGLTPSVSDLTQLTKAIQSGVIQYATDTGAANNIQVTLAPVPAAYPKFLLVKVAASPIAGGTTITVNALATVNVLMPTGVPLAGDEYGAGSVLLLGFDGAHYRVVGGAYPSNQALLDGLFALTPTTYTLYVRTDGSDAGGAHDGSANTAGKAFLTIGAALAYAAKNFTLGHATVRIVLGVAGVYAGVSIPAGFAAVKIEGNTLYQDNYVIDGGAGAAGVAINGGASNLTLSGVKVTSSAGWVAALSVNNGWCSCDHVTFYGPLAGYLIQASYAGTIQIGPGCRIGSGAVASAIYAYYGGVVELTASGSLELTGVYNFPAYFAYASWAGSIIGVHPAFTFIGSATGQRYGAVTNATINVYGAGGNVFPGNVAGITATGGIYQ